jgi:hypothetical protein
MKLWLKWECCFKLSETDNSCVLQILTYFFTSEKIETLLLGYYVRIVPIRSENEKQE